MIHKDKVKELYKMILQRIEAVHIGCFEGMNDPLFLISDMYPGIWLEHVNDSVIYATLEPKGIEIAKNTVHLFMDYQKEDGQLPCYVLNRAKMLEGYQSVVGYAQIQECVSFYTHCLRIYDMSKDMKLLERAYVSGVKWIEWLYCNRMTTNRGLIEQFCGFDTGHDQSGRSLGLSCQGNYVKDGVIMNASVLPLDDKVAPILAIDMNCTFYADIMALSKMAEILGKEEEAVLWKEKGIKVRELIFLYCYDEEEVFFYDVDKHGNKRKFLSSSLFHLFMEGVLDKEKDSVLINQIYSRHLKNPEEFWTNYPFPGMAASDPTTKEHAKSNCWGYYSQANIALRCIFWMDQYGFSEDFDILCEKWIEAWTEHSDQMKVGQELDPHTGIPSRASEWYSSCMIFYVYAVRRLKLV